jgi:hypothetical protein
MKNSSKKNMKTGKTKHVLCYYCGKKIHVKDFGGIKNSEIKGKPAFFHADCHLLAVATKKDI